MTHIYVNIKGVNQGLLSDKCSKDEGHEDKIHATGLNYSTFNDDEMIINFKKLTDRASPLLYNAVMDNEELQINIEVYSDNEMRKQIKINKAFITTMGINAKSRRGSEGEFEEISLECHDYNIVDFD
ncbi:type VI secretion system tube protein Hcp [Providencia manganoxydans]|uniref:type VI secretion system tube protein Hcp n=1 Tax=Providencia manganoxydans TaxID=2923283 RepID=UPI0034E3E388